MCIRDRDSLSQVAPSVLSLRLEPETDYEIVVKLLSTAAAKAVPALQCEFEKDKEFADVGYRLAPDLKRRFALHNTAFGSRVRSVFCNVFIIFRKKLFSFSNL